MKNMKRIELEDTFWLIILISRKVKIIMRSYTCNFLFLENKFQIPVHFEYTIIYEVLQNSKNWPQN